MRALRAVPFTADLSEPLPQHVASYERSYTLRKLPALDIKTHANHSPHVVLLGAGASIAALPRGDKNGRRLPALGNLVDVIGLRELLVAHGIDPYPAGGFEALYDSLTADPGSVPLRFELESRIRTYFAEIE